MSSTEERRIQRFFSERLTPAAEALRARGIALLETAPDPAAESYWAGPPGAAEPDFLEVEPEAFGEALAARWRAEGLPELADLAAGLMELAFALEMRQEQSAEVSPFVYVMY